MIAPTFNVDLIWHTHMRYPSRYQTVSTALCGFILDHDDVIEPKILTNVYQKTAEQWKKAYQSQYGHNIDRQHVETSQHTSSSATVVVPSYISSGGGASSCGATGGGYGSSCDAGDTGGCDGDGDSGGGCDGGGCGGDDGGD